MRNIKGRIGRITILGNHLILAIVGVYGLTTTKTGDRSNVRKAVLAITNDGFKMDFFVLKHENYEKEGIVGVQTMSVARTTNGMEDDCILFRKKNLKTKSI